MTPEELLVSLPDLLAVADAASAGSPWTMDREERCPYLVGEIHDIGICLTSMPLAEDERAVWPQPEDVARHVVTFDPAMMRGLLGAVAEMHRRAVVIAAENTMLRAARPFEDIELPMEQAS